MLASRKARHHVVTLREYVASDNLMAPNHAIKEPTC